VGGEAHWIRGHLDILSRGPRVPSYATERRAAKVIPSTSVGVKGMKEESGGKKVDQF